MDGWGYNPSHEYNAIYLAQPKNFNQWLREYPWAILAASGKAVGLPDGMMGNSAVGHFTIGCGRIIEQPVTYFNKIIDDGSFFNNKLLLQKFTQLKNNNKTLHILGLLSDAGVHSHEKHIHAFIRAAAQAGIKNIIVHAFLDGRDTAPQSAPYFLERLEQVFNEIGCGKLGSVHGRWYAMDRDGNWDRVEKSYQVLTNPELLPSTISWEKLLHNFYAQDITDEFIPPTRLIPAGFINDGDGVIFANIRADRARELTALLLDKHTYSFFITAIKYSPDLETDILLEQAVITDTLFDVLAQHHKTIFSIAESEKYAHVSYFFNGGKEIAHPGEKRVIIPSIPAKDYIHNPQMSAHLITDTVIKALEQENYDFYLINYANADMVGHSGNLEATTQAVQYIDHELGRLFDVVVKKYNGTLYITGDHGNAEDKFDQLTQKPRTAHTTNPVYFLMLSPDQTDIKHMNQLADIAPLILTNMGLTT